MQPQAEHNNPSTNIKSGGDTTSELNARACANPTTTIHDNGGRVTISPPANVKTPYQVLCSGIDSLVLAINVHWEKDSFFDYLATLKRQAQQKDSEAPGILDADNFGTWKFAIKPHGSDGYEWLLTGKAFALRIGNWKTPKSRPSVMVEIRSESLWHLGVADCITGIISILRSAGGSAIQINPSRVDLCVDMLFPSLNWEMGIVAYRVTRAQKSQVYLQHDHFTGFMIGSGKIAARAYDKAFEIERKSKKTWMYSIWGLDSVPNDQKVVRVEFQVRREALKELGINCFDDLLAHQENLWAYCSQKWLKFMDNPGKHQVTQRTVLPWWETVQNGFTGAQGAHPLVRGTAFRKDRDQLFKQSQGLLSSLVALHLEETGNATSEIDFNDLLIANYESAYADSSGESFQEKVEKKFHKYNRLAQKQVETEKKGQSMDSPSKPTATTDAELLTIEEFAAKMKVARTTVFNWLKTEKLRQGTHYIKIGRVIRFQWPDVLQHISEPPAAPVKPSRPEGRRIVKRQAGVAINLQYN